MNIEKPGTTFDIAKARLPQGTHEVCLDIFINTCHFQNSAPPNAFGMLVHISQVILHGHISQEVLSTMFVQLSCVFFFGRKSPHVVLIVFLIGASSF